MSDKEVQDLTGKSDELRIRLYKRIEILKTQGDGSKFVCAFEDPEDDTKCTMYIQADINTVGNVAVQLVSHIVNDMTVLGQAEFLALLISSAGIDPAAVMLGAIKLKLDK